MVQSCRYSTKNLTGALPIVTMISAIYSFRETSNNTSSNVNDAGCNKCNCWKLQWISLWAVSGSIIFKCIYHRYCKTKAREATTHSPAVKPVNWRRVHSLFLLPANIWPRMIGIITEYSQSQRLTLFRANMSSKVGAYFELMVPIQSYIIKCAWQHLVETQTSHFEFRYSRLFITHVAVYYVSEPAGLRQFSLKRWCPIWHYNMLDYTMPNETLKLPKYFLLHKNACLWNKQVVCARVSWPI